jgi:two-component system, cell cycle response regulator DivK
MRESFPARSGVLPFYNHRIPCRGGCWAEPPIICPRKHPIGRNPFYMTRSHRTKRNDGKPSRGLNGAVLDGRSAMSKTVMIVEDNELNMKLFHDLLEAYGYHPIGTRNGIEALDLARKHRPHLILMDIQLPEVSGLEVTKWLKEDAELKAIPVVAVTAFAMKGDEERIREAGCEAYLSKPIPVPQFIETIRGFLGVGLSIPAR